MGSELLGEIRREIDARLLELRPAIEEYEQLLHAAQALDAEEAPPTRRRRAAVKVTPSQADAAPAPAKAPRTVRGAAREAILGALEHGSHTVGELAVVTAMSAAGLNASLRKLAVEGAIAKTQREGKSAWMLAEHI
ncbi:MAG TPA: hypothetical protein VFW38_13545 [Solirubrobacteraceae bacterium]|nr:hypothetical protein [Solirubrobacteraceae bacterium]